MKPPEPILQYYVPKTLTKKRLDSFLAKGWFRTVNMLFKAKINCFDNDIVSPVNIRFRLSDHVFSKRLQKLYRRNQNLFRFEIKKATIDEAREDLFHQQQKRFSGFLSNNLEEFIVLTPNFDTYEIDVYDDDKLVAVSYFDEGHESVMGLLGVFDAAYSSYGLGNYTMMLEIEYAKARGYKWYYPGYVHNKPSIYDYKLRFGKAQVYDKGRWKYNLDPHQIHSLADTVKNTIYNIERLLVLSEISYQRKIYIFYGWHYFSTMYKDFFRSPFCFILQDGRVITFDIDTGLFVCLRWELHIPFRDIRLPLAPDFKESVHCIDIMKITEYLFQSDQIDDLLDYLLIF